MAQAAPLPEFYYGVRPTAMGNAFTAVSDDGDAVFYNPAGLARVRSYQVRIGNGRLGISSDDIAIASDIKDLASGFTASSLQPLFGKNLYAGFSNFPSLLFPGFTIGYYMGGEFHLRARNLAMPSIQARYVMDKGLVSGFGYETRGISRKHSFRFGTTLKWIERSGLDATLKITDLISADANYLKSLAGSSGYGLGLGVGLQYDIWLGRSSTLTLGGAWQDIGNTQFGSRNATKRPASQESNLSVGTAFEQDLGRVPFGRGAALFSFDLRNLNRTQIDPRLRLHIGSELKLGLLSIQGGWMQSGFTAGAKLEFFIFEVAGSTYVVENQALAFLDPERRYSVHLTMRLDFQGQTKKTRIDDERVRRPRSF